MPAFLGRIQVCSPQIFFPCNYFVSMVIKSFRLTIDLQFYLQAFVFILIAVTNSNGQEILDTGCYFAHLKSVSFFCICVMAWGEKALWLGHDVFNVKSLAFCCFSNAIYSQMPNECSLKVYFSVILFSSTLAISINNSSSCLWALEVLSHWWKKQQW